MGIPILDITITLVLGLVLGSFATAVAHRECHDQQWWGVTRSNCPQCKTALTARDLFPIFSWLLSAGKCRHCKKPISKLYPVVELYCALLCLLVYMLQGLTVLSTLTMLAVPFLLALTIVDFRLMILPDRLLVALAIIASIRIVIQQMASLEDLSYLYLPVIGAFVFMGLSLAIKLVAEKILKKPAMGQGDIKLFAVCGLWLGPFLLADFLILSGLLGITIGIMWRITTKSPAFPFGPALIASLLILILTESSFLLKFII